MSKSFGIVSIGLGILVVSWVVYQLAFSEGGAGQEERSPALALAFSAVCFYVGWKRLRPANKEPS